MEVKFETIDRFPGYRFGADGTIWSCWMRVVGQPSVPSSEWVELSPTIGSRGYRVVALKLFGGPVVRNLSVHRLILEAFKGPCPDGWQACHNNGIRDDNRIDNLRWDTQSGNFADKRRHGTHLQGERHPRARLTALQVEQIRQLYAEGVLNQPQLAARFSVCQSTISNVLLGVTHAAS